MVYNLVENSLDFQEGALDDPHVAESFYAQFHDFDYGEDGGEEEDEEEEDEEGDEKQKKQDTGEMKFATVAVTTIAVELLLKFAAAAAAIGLVVVEVVFRCDFVSL